MSELKPAPAGWEIRVSKSKGKSYYFCPATKESRWEYPQDAAAGQSAKRARTEIEQVRASHILCKHKDSRRPSSWREHVITRTKDEAREIVSRYLADIKSGRAKFADLAKKYSDCSSAEKGGDLGLFGRGKMQPSFEKAAFALAVDEISGLVESDSGVHIILRTA
eukprot:m.243606 g.243606  ORF g.243606 m.243606 type:complete len:165 (-) comp14266_c0_seq1:36-530(-)